MLSVTANAQLCISGGTRAMYTSYATMNDFRTSFNSYLSDRIDRELKPFTLGKGYELGLTYQLGVMYFNIVSYSQLFYSRTVKYKTGEMRHFDLRLNSYTSGLGFGYCNDDDVSFYIVGNLMTASAILKTYYEYNDGSIDMGPSHQLNGRYTCLISMKPTVSARYSMPLTENLSFYGNLEYVFAYNIRFDKGNLKFYMYDLNEEKMMANQMSELPCDYEKYYELGGTWSAYYSQGDNNYVEGDISGFMLTLGVKYNIPGTKVE